MEDGMDYNLNQAPDPALSLYMEGKQKVLQREKYLFT
jgi:hypothetical protein